MSVASWKDHFNEDRFCPPTICIFEPDLDKEQPSTTEKEDTKQSTPALKKSSSQNQYGKYTKFKAVEVSGLDKHENLHSTQAAGTGVHVAAKWLSLTKWMRFALKTLKWDDSTHANYIHDEGISKKNTAAQSQHNNTDSMYDVIRSKGLTNLPTDSTTTLSKGRCFLLHKTTENEALCKKHLYDAAGGTIVHQCFQQERYDIVKWFVRSFPKFSLEPFLLEPPEWTDRYPEKLLPYGGQNLLHMAVLIKNREFARWLLDFYSKHSDESLFRLLTQRVHTRGNSYFRKEGHYYFGETPLQFAVCMNDIEMVNLLLSYIAILHNNRKLKECRNLLFMPDCHGNNVIHLCVLHNIPEMYDHIHYLSRMMLRQELMREFHGSLASNPSEQQKYKPSMSDYPMVYGNADPDDVKSKRFEFKGFLRNGTEVLLPSVEVQKLFYDIQYCKLRHSMKLGAGSPIDEQVAKLLKPHQQFDQQSAAAGAGSEEAHREEELMTSVVNLLSNNFGGIGDSENRQSIMDALDANTDLSKYPKEDVQAWLRAKEEELKNAMRQWLYGTDRGLKDGVVYGLFNVLFLYGLNEDGHSPVTLAAERGKAEILRHLLLETVVKRARSYDFDLTAIEFPLDRESKNYSQAIPASIVLRSAISWICRNEAHYHLIDCIPELKEVIIAKWERIGAMIATRNNILHLVFMACIIMEACFVNYNTREFIHHRVSGQYSTYLLAACAAVVLINSIFDAYYWWNSGFQFFQTGLFHAYPKILYNRLPSGVALYDAVLRFLIAVVFVVIIFVRFYMNVLRESASWGRFNDIYCTLIGACAFGSLLYCFTFLTLFYDQFGCFLMAVVKVLTQDFPQFARFFFHIVIMYGIFIKTITVDIDKNGYIHALHEMWCLLRVSFNVQDTVADDFLSSTQSTEYGWYCFLVLSFNLVVLILIINLLIAVMSNTYADFVGEKALAKLRCQRYLWMEYFLDVLLDVPKEKLLKKYCRTKKSLADGQTSHFFEVNRDLGGVNCQVKEYFKDHPQIARTNAMDLNPNNDNDLDADKSKVINAGNAQTIFNPESLVNTGYNDSDIQAIFKCNFWLNSEREHPKPGQLITHSDVTSFAMTPVDAHKVDFCRYITEKIEAEGGTLQLSYQKRKILFILDGQNDFCDNVPALVPRSELIIVGDPNPVQQGEEKWKNALSHQARVSSRGRTGRLMGLKVKTEVVPEPDSLPRPGSPTATNVLSPISVISPAPGAIPASASEENRSDVYCEVLWTEICQISDVELVDANACAVVPPGLRGVVNPLVPGEAPSTSSSSSSTSSSSSSAGSAVDDNVSDASRARARSRSSTSGKFSVLLAFWENVRHKATRVFRKGHEEQKGIVFDILGDKDNNKIELEILWDTAANVPMSNNCNSSGSLATRGSFDDSERTYRLIKSKWKEYDEIVVSRDCHRANHIGHAGFWKCGNGVAATTIGPFTTIRYIDVLAGYYKAADDTFKNHALDYTWELQLQGRYKHCIWPTHCLIGPELNLHPYGDMGGWLDISDRDVSFREVNSHRGQELISSIHRAIQEWQGLWKKEASVKKIVKTVDIGYDITTEAFSVFKSEAENFANPSSGLNAELLHELNNPDTEIHICGQALSHVVRWSIETLIAQSAAKITLLLNCTSFVPRFYEAAVTFVKDIMQKGVEVVIVDRLCNLHRIKTLEEVENVVGRNPSEDILEEMKSYQLKKEIFYKARCEEQELVHEQESTKVEDLV